MMTQEAPKPVTEADLAGLRARIAKLRQEEATHNARLEQAQAQLVELENTIKAEFGVVPTDLDAAITAAESEVQSIVAQINQELTQAGF